LSGPLSVETFGKFGNTLGTFNTQMLSMDLRGSVGSHSVEIITDPSQASTGQTTIADNGGGTFHITSFFDVFTELSLDGGSFIPQSNGPALVTLTTTPLPSSLWGGLTPPIALAAGLALASSCTNLRCIHPIGVPEKRASVPGRSVAVGRRRRSADQSPPQHR
jgi:hypothetical protein